MVFSEPRRSHFHEERKLNLETFGQATVDQSRYRNNYRGRGGYRGGRGGNNYYRNNNTHILNTTTSSSKLVIGGANLKIKSTVNYPTFFDVIMSYSDNLFVCDFINKDYFWLDKIRKNNYQKEFNIVQYQ